MIIKSKIVERLQEAIVIASWLHAHSRRAPGMKKKKCKDLSEDDAGFMYMPSH